MPYLFVLASDNQAPGEARRENRNGTCETPSGSPQSPTTCLCKMPRSKTEDLLK